MANDDYPRAFVREIDGQLVLEDPDALVMIKVVDKINCRQTFEAQAERVAYFKNRIVERGESPDNVIIVLLNVDDPNGGRLAEILMPGNGPNWQAMRDKGMVPFARGLAARRGVQELVSALDKDTGDKLAAMAGRAAVVVMDFGVVEAFEA